MHLFITRHPVFDRNDHLAAYELLYRPDGPATTATSTDESRARLVVETFFGMDLEHLVGEVPAVLPVSRTMVVGAHAESLDRSRVMLQLPADNAPDPALVIACRALASTGFRLVLDGLRDAVAWAPVLDVSHAVSLDVLAFGIARLGRLSREVEPYEVRLLAKRVDNATLYDACARMGFDLFAGTHLSRPEVMERRDLTVQQVAMAHLLNRLRDPFTPEADIVDAFRSDPSLSYKLLKLVNSAAVGGRGVDSIPHALRMVGRSRLYRWLVLLMMSSSAGEGERGSEMLFSALLRARFCELCSGLLHRPADADPLFLTGLFSRMGALLGVPLETALDTIDLSDEIRAALLRREGPYAAPLALATAYGAGRWDEAMQASRRLGITPARLPTVYVDALEWTRRQLQAAGL